MQNSLGLAPSKVSISPYTSSSWPPHVNSSLTEPGVLRKGLATLSSRYLPWCCLLPGIPMPGRQHSWARSLMVWLRACWVTNPCSNATHGCAGESESGFDDALLPHVYIYTAANVLWDAHAPGPGEGSLARMLCRSCAICSSLMSRHGYTFCLHSRRRSFRIPHLHKPLPMPWILALFTSF